MNLLYKFGFHYHYCSCTEPATAPQNVETTAESSTEITVTWERVLAIDENGIIINYEVQFEPLEFTETLSTSSVNTSDLTVVISSLQEYVQYNISVRAYTIVGPGPYSDPVTQRTLEDGMYFTQSLLCGIIAYHIFVGDSTEPGASPESIQATAISSSTIMVTWGEVPAIHQNGIIINYDIRVEPLQFTGELETETINTTNLSASITGLKENIEYNISVRAYTSVGPGPYSDPVTERTSENGMFYSIFLLQYNSH